MKRKGHQDDNDSNAHLITKKKRLPRNESKLFHALSDGMKQFYPTDLLNLITEYASSLVYMFEPITMDRTEWILARDGEHLDPLPVESTSSRSPASSSYLFVAIPGPLVDFNQFDPIVKDWKALPFLPLPLRRASHCILDDSLYVLGGTSKGARHKESFVFRGNPGEWKALPPCPCYTAEEVVAVPISVQRRIYLIDFTTHGHVFDTISETWSHSDFPVLKPITKSSLLFPVGAVAGVAKGTTIFAVKRSGEDPDQCLSIDVSQEKDLQWQTLPSFPPDSYIYDFVLIVVGELLVAITQSIKGVTKMMTLRLDVKDQRWTSVVHNNSIKPLSVLVSP